MMHWVDGHEAYLDSPEYTSPEMLPGHGVDIGPEPTPERAVNVAAGFSIGSAGGALASQAIMDDVGQEKAQLAPHHA